MHFLSLESFVEKYPVNHHYVIAYSGGVDSHVLLHALTRLSKHKSFSLKAIHVNHGLSSHAAEWAAHCQRVCDALNIPLEVLSVSVPRDSQDGLEAAARKKRYEAIGARLQASDYLLTGHHQEDQAETLLLQLFRGAGVKGLAAMSVLKQRTGFVLARPLLSVSRGEILDYAKEQGLSWIEDESNQDESLRRNFLRHTIIPALQNFWPEVTGSIAQTAQHCAETQALLQTLLQQTLSEMNEQGRLKLSVLRKKTLPMQRALLRAWLEGHGALMPSVAVLERMIEDVVYAGPDAHPLLRWGGYSLRRVKDELFFEENRF